MDFDPWRDWVQHELESGVTAFEEIQGRVEIRVNNSPILALTLPVTPESISVPTITSDQSVFLVRLGANAISLE